MSDLQGQPPLEWQTREAERCRRAFRCAKSFADRLALLRSLSRLLGGRTDLALEQIELFEDEIRSLRRFGVGLHRNILRIVDEQDGSAPIGFWDAERLDTATRQVSSDASPDAVLVRHIGFKRYRTLAQKAGVRAVLTMPPGAALMVSMPTGSGKSLIFQIEAIRTRIAEPGSCIAVITPTVSLALDHARNLATIQGLENSRALTGDLNAAERSNLLDSFRRGEVPVLLLSPEYAFGAAREALLEAATPRAAKFQTLAARLHMIVVDEAHIIESWGRSFRPDFQRLPALIGKLRQLDPSLKLLLLSATLPPAARQVLRQAYATNCSWLEIDAHTPRYEFDIVVQPYASGEERRAALDFIIDRVPRPAIIYTTLVDEPNSISNNDMRTSAEHLYGRLRSRGYDRIALFTGNIDDTSERRRIVEDWAEERLDLVVATSAFGMGVDKRNVRTVVHACLPEGASRWYQEIGRASRDEHQGLAVCLFTQDSTWNSRDDVRDAYAQATGSWLTREKAVPRWRALLKHASNPHWGTDGHRMTLDLDAARIGLDPRRSTDYNRSWNMSLLNLMQRAGVLEVISATGGGCVPQASWDIEIKDPMILSESDSLVWDRIFTIRDGEQSGARAGLNQFVRLMSRPDEDCILRGVFRLIEEDAPDDLPACGRCPSCRANGRRQPQLVACHGLETVWPSTAENLRSPLPSGVTLITPRDPTYETGFEGLVLRLVASGIEQFVVPDPLTAQTARTLGESPVRFGLAPSRSMLELSLARSPA